MEDKKLTTAEVTQQSVKTRAEELGKVHNCKVIPFVFYAQTDEEQTDPVIGYLKEPSRLAKTRALDKAGMMGEYTASDELFQVCLIKEASDPRIYSENQEFDAYYFGALSVANQSIKMALDQYKKK